MILNTIKYGYKWKVKHFVDNEQQRYFFQYVVYVCNNIYETWLVEASESYPLGASVKLVAEDTQVQTEILEMIHSNVSVEACKNCCENFGVTPIIEKLGIDIKYMGEPFTEYLKNGEKVLSI